MSRPDFRSEPAPLSLELLEDSPTFVAPKPDTPRCSPSHGESAAHGERMASVEGAMGLHATARPGEPVFSCHALLLSSLVGNQGCRSRQIIEQGIY